MRLLRATKPGHRRRGARATPRWSRSIEATFWDREKGRGLYGVRKMWHQLRRDGSSADRPVARCTVERLMRAGLRGVRRGRPVVTTRPDPPRAGRRTWSTAIHRDRPEPAVARRPDLRADLVGHGVHRVRLRRVLPADRRAGAPRPRCPPSCRSTRWRWRCGPGTAGRPGGRPGSIHHSDAGSPIYRRSATPNRLAEAGAVASIGSVGDSYDNALAESVIGLYKTECVRHDGPWRTVDDLELATLSLGALVQRDTASTP